MVYNVYMSPRHFNKLSNNEWTAFDKDVKVITGMLYTIGTFPLRPFIPSLRKKAAGDQQPYQPLYNLPHNQTKE